MNCVALGNLGALDGNDSGEPFVFMAIPADMVDAVGVGAMVMALDGSATATVAIRGEAETVHPLNEKYIPDSVGIPVVQLIKYGLGGLIDLDGEVLSVDLDEEKLADLRDKLRKGFAFVYANLNIIELDHIDADNTIQELNGMTGLGVQIVKNNEDYYGVCNIPNGKQFRLELSSSRKLSVALKTVTT
jgi:hypothetical protein